MPGSPEPPGVSPDTLRDVSYVAQRLAVRDQRVYELVGAGLLGHYKLGHRTLRFSDEHIEAFLAQHEVSA